MKGLSLKQLDAIRALARRGSVTGAAAATGVTPSAMTTRLKELEAVCGLPLFERANGALTFNRAGMAVLGLAEQVQNAVDAIQTEIAGLTGLATGLLSIGVVSTAKYFAPRLIADFARRYPGVEIRLSVGNRAQMIDSLARLAVDIVVMGRPPAGVELIAEPFGEHPLVVIAPPDHPLVGRQSLKAADLRAWPFLLREEGSGTRAAFEELFGHPTPGARDAMEIGSNETIKQAVMAGLGLALISAHTVAFELETRRLAILEVEGLPVRRTWFIARHARRTPLPAIRAFWKYTRLEGAQHLPAVLI